MKHKPGNVYNIMGDEYILTGFKLGRGQYACLVHLDSGGVWRSPYPVNDFAELSEMDFKGVADEEYKLIRECK